MGTTWNARPGRSSSWIRIERRQRIYARDGGRCVYCQCDPWRGLTLDHIKPRHKGGTHASRNLVTACQSCNSKRADGPLRGFVLRIAAETGQAWREVFARVQATRRRSLCRSSTRGKSPAQSKRAAGSSSSRPTEHASMSGA